MVKPHSRMGRCIAASLAALGTAAAAMAQSTDPVGPSGWTTRNWIGFSVQIAVFILAVIGICKLASFGDES